MYITFPQECYWYASLLKANLTYILVWKVGLFPGALTNHCAFLGWIHHDKTKHLFKNPHSKQSFFFFLHLVQFPWTYVDYLLLIVLPFVSEVFPCSKKCLGWRYDTIRILGGYMSTIMRDYNENTKGNPSSLIDQTMVCITWNMSRHSPSELGENIM